MIAFYKGISPFSRLIRFATWSEYSHASWIDNNYAFEIEAWSKGVTTGKPFTNHTPGTVVDLFDVPLPADLRAAAVRFLQSQLGKPYDWAGILGFATHRAQRNPAIMTVAAADAMTKWFCAELIFAALAFAQFHPLFRIPQYKVTPGLLSYSPRLAYITSVRVPPFKALSSSSVSLCETAASGISHRGHRDHRAEEAHFQ